MGNFHHLEKYFHKSNILLNIRPPPPPKTPKIDLQILKNCHHTLLKQVAKVQKDFNRFLLSQVVCSQTWLNLFVDDHKCGNITKLKLKNSKSLLYIYIYIYNFKFIKKYKKVYIYFSALRKPGKNNKKKKVSAKAGSYWRRRINTERQRGGWRAAKIKGQ
jgi:hypothetical protein